MKTFNQFLREFGLDNGDNGYPSTTSPLKKIAGSSTGKKFLDAAQFGADVVGVFDPTPITDLANAAVSVGRGSIAKTPEEKEDHYVNAGLRAVSAVPYAGDAIGKTALAAKLAAKGGRATRVLTSAEKAATSPEARRLALKAKQSAQQATRNRALGNNNQEEEEEEI